MNPSHWASFIPRNPAEQEPNPRDGTRGASAARAPATGARWGPPGLRDWTLEGIHLSMIDLASHEPDVNTIVSMEKA